MRKNNIDKELYKYKFLKLPFNKYVLPFLNNILEKSYKKARTLNYIKEKRLSIKGYKDEMIDIDIFEPDNSNNKLPCLVYFHGGAFAMKAAPHHKKIMMEYMENVPCKVVFPDYRLIPDYPFPYGLEDCYKTLEWVYNNADRLGIDEKKIAIGGDSAGGALAIGVSMLSRDRDLCDICFQFLIYPVIDASQSSNSITRNKNAPVWNSKLNKKMWDMYDFNLDETLLEYKSPVKITDFRKMPKTYIEVSSNDCLKDEGILFGKKLSKNGIEVQVVERLGSFHGFEVAIKTEFVKKAIKDRVEVLRKALK